MAARVRRWAAPGSGGLVGTAGVVVVLAAGAVTGVRPLPALVSAVLAVLVALSAGVHRRRLVLSVAAELPALLAATAAAAAVVLSSAGPLVFAPVALAGQVLALGAGYASTRLLRRTGRLGRPVLVVGTGPTARRLAVTLLAHPELGLRPTGFVATGGAGTLGQARGLPQALLGPVTALPRAMSEAEVDAAVVALAGPPGDAEVAALEGLLASSAEVHAVPDWLPAGLAHAPHRRELVGGVPVVRLRRDRPPLPVRAVERLADVLVAVVTLSVLLPLGGVLALLVLVETGGVLVVRPAVDERGRTLPEPRFRTRRTRSVQRPGTTFSVTIPGRTGPVGWLLLRTGLDAVPAVAAAMLRRLRYAGATATGSAPAARADQAQVDAGQLAR